MFGISCIPGKKIKLLTRFALTFPGNVT